MSRIDAWSGNTFPLSAWTDDHDPGVDTALLIADKPTSITISRGASTLSAQTVRIEEFRGQKQVQSSAGQVYNVDAVVLGHKGHPTITDTDIKPGDRFAVAGVLFEVQMLVVGLADGVQAYARVRG
jgi:hypothetical protein